MRAESAGLPETFEREGREFCWTFTRYQPMAECLADRWRELETMAGETAGHEESGHCLIDQKVFVRCSNVLAYGTFA